MAHYAFLDENNIVNEVIVGVDENQLIEGKTPEEWYSKFRNKKCVRTSYNGNIRKRYAGIGFRYDEELDAFIPPKPYPSWYLDTTIKDWVAPVPQPPTGLWIWDEENQIWLEVLEEIN